MQHYIPEDRTLNSLRFGDLKPYRVLTAPISILCGSEARNTKAEYRRDRERGERKRERERERGSERERGEREIERGERDREGRER
jgi:hypothetical protein